MYINEQIEEQCVHFADHIQPMRVGALPSVSTGGRSRTDDDRVVVGDQHLAVDVDELGDQLPLQLGVSPQTRDGDVVHPLVSHWVCVCGEGGAGGEGFGVAQHRLEAKATKNTPHWLADGRCVSVLGRRVCV